MAIWAVKRAFVRSATVVVVVRYRERDTALEAILEGGDLPDQVKARLADVFTVETLRMTRRSISLF